jgi:hypothetical protein
MKEATLSLELAQQAFEPGAECVGKASWECPSGEIPESVELRLIWKVESEGPDDVTFAAVLPLENPHTRESRGFRLQLPEGPYSLKGVVLDIRWFAELVVKPCKNVARADLTLAPGGKALELEDLKEEADVKLGKWIEKFRPQS